MTDQTELTRLKAEMDAAWEAYVAREAAWAAYVAEGAMSDLDADRKAKQYKGTQDYHARKKLEDYIRTKERVIAGGNALSPGERRSLAQARKELKALTSKNQGVAARDAAVQAAWGE